MELTVPKLLVVLFLLYLLITCTSSPDRQERKRELLNSNKPVLELTQKQQAAFDALNELQVSTDEKNRIYSTFPNLQQPCYPADTSFEISQSELLIFMEQFVVKHCQELLPEQRIQLANSSVLAQKEYTVLFCADSPSDINYEKGITMTGTWVLPSILGRRDVILVW